MGFDLGVPGRWPLNNPPFYRGPARIDRFTGIRADARPFFDDLVRFLMELDRLDREEATRALAAFLRRRIAHADAERTLRRSLVASTAVLAEVIEIAREFVTENPEGGRRGQAFTAVVLDCAYREVRMRSINDPQPIDVSAWEGDRMLLAAEVKQLPADESMALALAREAADQGCDRGLLVALDPSQRPLDRVRIRHDALIEHGVLVEVCASVEDLVARALIGSRMPLTDAARALQEWYPARMREHGLPLASEERWEALCAALSI
jgi:hypothetical protein